jgi:OOP family OmpA-OmpF porin
MKYIVLYSFLVISSLSFGQNESQEVSDENEFDRWSIEVNAGMNKPTKPFTFNYYSSDPKKYFNISSVNHFDVGARYMLSNSFGLKIDFGYDKIENQKGSGSLDFEAIQYRVGLQGVANLGSIMNFRSFTNRFNLLAHAGIQISQFTPKVGRFREITEDNGGVVFGFTPQLRITNSIVLTGDFSVINNLRQHYNWDGVSLSTEDNNLSGTMFVSSVGLTYYIGKNKKHADWSDNIPLNKKVPDDAKDSEARKRIAELEKMLNDVDRDGVADYLDSQNNTPNGVVVDTKGRFIDVNRNGVPDELEKDGINEYNSSLYTKNNDAMSSLVKNDYVNVFYDVNQDYPNSGSTSTVYQLIEFMKKNATVKINLQGFADLRGGDSFNKDLSFRRANNLMKILVDSGIANDRIKVEAVGVDKVFNGNKENLDYARRVSVTIVK